MQGVNPFPSVEARFGSAPAASRMRTHQSLPSMQAAILEGGQPLGGILVETGTVFGSSPLGYFRVKTDVMGDIFSASPDGAVLFGRYNQLLGEDGACLARIIEILPGVPES